MDDKNNDNFLNENSKNNFEYNQKNQIYDYIKIKSYSSSNKYNNPRRFCKQLNKLNIENRIPFTIENLMIYKKFLANENNNFFAEDLANFYLLFSKILANELKKFANKIDLNFNILTENIYTAIIKCNINNILNIYLNLMFQIKNKENFNQKDFNEIFNILNTNEKSEIFYFSKSFDLTSNIYNIEYTKKAPFSLFISAPKKEDFYKDVRMFEPFIVTIYNFFYFFVHFLLGLIKCPIISSVYPKLLKNKLLSLDKMFDKLYNLFFDFENIVEDKINIDKNEFKIIFDFIKLIEMRKDSTNKNNKKLIYLTLNVINTLLYFFEKLSSKSKNLIRRSQGILEILINLIVYKNYLDNYIIDAQTYQDLIKQRKIKIEKNISLKIKLILKDFDKLIVFKSIIMLIDLNKKNKFFIKIISKFNSLIAINSYSDLLCLFNVFDLSNLNYDTTTKLVKKLFCSIPEFIEKEKYFIKVIDCFFDLIIILKNRDSDDKINGVKEFAINIFNEIILSFSDDIEFSRILFCRFFSRFFRLFGYGIYSIKKKFQQKGKLDKNNNQRYFYRIFPKNTDSYSIKIDNKLINFLKFLILNFGFQIKNKFQKLFENIDNIILFQAIVEIISTFTKNKKIEEIDNEKIKHRNNTINENRKLYSEVEFIETIIEICSMILENFEKENIADIFYNYFNSDMLENIFKLDKLNKKCDKISKLRSVNILYDYEFKNVELDSIYNEDENKIILKVKKISEAYKNLIYFSNFDTAVNYMNIIESLFEINNFNKKDFLNSFMDILSERNFFEKKNFNFLDILNEENIFMHYNNKLEYIEDEKKNKKQLKLDLLTINFYNNNLPLLEEEIIDLVYKVNNFYMILKNKIFQTFSKKIALNNELILENQIQAFKFILMILSNIPNEIAENKYFFNNYNLNNIDEEVIELVINCLGFILIHVMNSKDQNENGIKKNIENTKINNMEIDNTENKIKNLIYENNGNLISKLQLLENKYINCQDIIEKIKIFSLQRNNNNQTFLNKPDIHKLNINKKCFLSKDELNNTKIFELLEKIEIELKKFFQIENYNSNFEKSFILYKTYNLLNKEIKKFKIDKNYIETPSKLLLEKIKNLLDIYIGFIKNIDDYLWKIAQKNILLIFEIFFLFKTKDNFQLFFNIIDSTVKNIKNLSTENEYILKQKEQIKKNSKKQNKINEVQTNEDLNMIIKNISIKEKSATTIIFEEKLKLEKKIINKQKEINFETQYFLKMIELLEMIIKKNKFAIVTFWSHIFKIIFKIFDDYFYTFDPIIISSLFSLLSTIISYCGLEINQELNTLIRTCLNILKNFEENVLIRRACSNLLFKILTNCNFLHYQNYAKDIYNLIKLNLDNRLKNDKIVLFFMEKCIKYIKESVYEFYNKEVELTIMKDILNTDIKN